MSGVKNKWGSNITRILLFQFFRNSQQPSQVFLLRISLGNVNASVVTC